MAEEEGREEVISASIRSRVLAVSIVTHGRAFLYRRAPVRDLTWQLLLGPAFVLQWLWKVGVGPARLARCWCDLKL